MSTFPVAPWEPPGPGQWTRDTTHVPGCATAWSIAVVGPAIEEGFGGAFRAYGSVVTRSETAVVNGRNYATVRFVEPDDASELEIRAANAAAVLATQQWREEGRRWFSDQRAAEVRANRALQAEEPAGLSDEDLTAHAQRAAARAADGVRLHFELHGPDMVPIGFFVLSAHGWGISNDEAIELLAGSSPASASTMEPLGRIAEALRAAGVGDPTACPTTLDALRAVSPEVDAAVGDYLDEYGHRAVVSYDISSPTLHELPAAIVACVRAALAGPGERAGVAGSTAALEAMVRDRVPPEDRDRFDELLREARFAYSLRDDNVGVTFMWPLGLARRAMLEVGGRLVARDALADAADALDAEPAEVGPLLAGDLELAGRVRERAAARRFYDSVDAPVSLGEGLGPPPELLARMTPEMIQIGMAQIATNSLWAATPGRQPMTGIGIGTAPYRGRAVVAHDPATAIARLEPGDVLVVPFTTPAYNAVLPAVGALVTAEGGLLAHAALVARELGIPAVIGAARAMDITDGAEVEVDPSTGEVRVLSP